MDPNRAQQYVRALPPPIDPSWNELSTKRPSRTGYSGMPGFQKTEEYPEPRPNFRYFPCTPNPWLPSLLYATSEAPPYVAGMSELDHSKDFAFSKVADGLTASEKVTTKGGYVSGRANVGIRGGSWYFEVDIIKSSEPDNDANVRIGIGRREATLESPVGSDVFGYGLQALRGNKVHMSRPSKFTEPMTSGDTIGFHVVIPRPDVPPVYARRDRFPVPYKGQLFYEQLEYAPTKASQDLLTTNADLAPKEGDLIEGSRLDVYKNGQFVGTMFENLQEFLPPKSQFSSLQRLPFTWDDGYVGYFPMISSYCGGEAHLNCGPDFKGTLPAGARPLSQRYDEQIADDVALDLLDQAGYEAADFERGVTGVRYDIRVPRPRKRKPDSPAPPKRRKGTPKAEADAPKEQSETNEQSELKEEPKLNEPNGPGELKEEPKLNEQNEQIGQNEQNELKEEPQPEPQLAEPQPEPTEQSL